MTPRAAQAAFELRSALACGDHAIEPEQRQQRTSLWCRDFRIQREVAVAQALDFDAVDGGYRRLRGQRRAGLELRRVELDYRARVVAISVLGVLVEAEVELEAGRTWQRRDGVEARAHRRRKRLEQRGEIAQRIGGGFQRELARCLGAVEAAARFRGHAAGLAEPQLLQRERRPAVAEFRGERPQLLARRDRAADIERKLRFLRPFALRPRKRPHKTCGGIEVEAVSPKLRVDPRALARAGLD